MTPEEIKALRLSRGESQFEFAHVVGTTTTTINRWENDRSKPSKVFIRIMKNLQNERP